jgi:hypothetical protein
VALTMTKACIECGVPKLLSEYYRHPGMADGTLGVCKVCHKRRMKERRLTNPYVQEYDRERYHDPARKARTAEIAQRWAAQNPEARRAQYAVNNAVRDGRLKKMPCALCGSENNIQGHHKDYGRPLDVVWLCATCHHRVHAIFPELGGHYEKRA